MDFNSVVERRGSLGTAWEMGSWGGLCLLTERARLARVATTSAAKADGATSTNDAAVTASRRRGCRASVDTGVTDRTRTGTPVGGHDSGAQTTSHARTGTEASKSSTTGTETDRTIIDGQRALLLDRLLLPPARVSVEQAQLLLGLSVVRHLVLVLAALLGEGAGSVVDPLVAVDLLAPGAAAGAGAVAVLGQGTGRGSSVEAAGRQDEGTTAGAGGRIDNRVDARLSCGVVTCQPSERLKWLARSA